MSETARGCWHVWRKRKTRRLYVETTDSGADFFLLYPKQCAACFLAAHDRAV